MKVALLLNIIAPYRVPVYERIAREFDLRIIITGMEDNRMAWETAFEEPVKDLIHKARGFTIRKKVQSGNGVYDFRYLHIPLGGMAELKRFNPDAIISSEMGLRTLIALMYGKLNKKPVWIWWGGSLHTEKKIGFLRKLIRKLVCRVSDHWISYGESSTKYLLNLGVERNSILQIQNSIDEFIYLKSSKPLYNPEIKPALLYVGQLIDRKGIPQLINTVAALQEEGLSFSLYLVGDGPERAKYEQQASSLNVQHIYFLGNKAPRDLPSVYKSMDCFVLPTLEDVWGLVLNEAIWSKLPVVASCYAGATEEIIPEKYRFDPLDKLEFQSAIRKAVRGNVHPIDTEKLLTTEEVASKIINRINKEFMI